MLGVLQVYGAYRPFSIVEDRYMGPLLPLLLRLKRRRRVF